MSSADHALASSLRRGSAGAHRRADVADVADRARTTQRWAIAVLTLATVVLLGYVAVLAAAAWVFAWALEAVTAREAGALDALAVAADVAPVLLVGWCTGLATSAVLARGETLGPRTAGLVAGSVGAVAGTVVMALAGLL